MAMKMRVQLAIESDEGEVLIKDIAALTRDALSVDTQPATVPLRVRRHHPEKL